MDRKNGYCLDAKRRRTWHNLRRMDYGDAKALWFCGKHWREREDFQPASPEAVKAAFEKINQLLANTHHLLEACRKCGAISPRDTIACVCGSTDLEPITEANKPVESPEMDDDEPF